MQKRMSFCRKCGAELAADAQFCQRCGTAVPVPVRDDVALEATHVDPPRTVVVPPPPAPQRIPVPPPGTRTPPAPPPVKKGGTGWWIVPLVVIGIVVIAWLLLAGLPFGREEKKIAASTPAVETIGEGQAGTPGSSTGTVVDVTPDQTLTAAAPPNVSTAAPAATRTEPEPQIIEEHDNTPAPRPSTTPRPAPVQPRPAPVQPRPAPRDTPPPAETPKPKPQPAGEISEGEAASTLRGFITSRNYYSDVAGGCVQVRSEGYRNVGYAFSVWDSCVSGGGTRMLGRWRVDAKTREVFRQQGSGRYLRP